MSGEKSLTLRLLEEQRADVQLKREKLALRREQKLTNEVEACPKPGTGVKEWRAAAFVFALLLIACECLTIKLALDMAKKDEAIAAAQLDTHRAVELLSLEKADSLKLQRAYQRNLGKLQAQLKACHNANPKWGTGPR
ncbi:MAG: hypothetical protein KGL39_34945 [Patescibacteria group bacterium]|nr:hypothetical protein [Patescibacteria group bacterium]